MILWKGIWAKVETYGTWRSVEDHGKVHWATPVEQCVTHKWVTSYMGCSDMYV